MMDIALRKLSEGWKLVRLGYVGGHAMVELKPPKPEDSLGEVHTLGGPPVNTHYCERMSSDDYTELCKRFEEEHRK